MPLTDPEAEVLLAPIPERERLSSWHLVHPDSRYSSRGSAGIDLVASLGYRRVWATAARFAGPLERLYAIVAAHRDKLGRVVPDGPAPRRFP